LLNLNILPVELVTKLHFLQTSQSFQIEIPVVLNNKSLDLFITNNILFFAEQRSIAPLPDMHNHDHGQFRNRSRFLLLFSFTLSVIFHKSHDTTTTTTTTTNASKNCSSIVIKSMHCSYNKRKSMTLDDHHKSFFDRPTTRNPKSCLKRRQRQQQSTASSIKRVQFSEYSQQYDILHVKDYTEEERDACFFQAADLNRIRIDVNKTLRAMLTGQFPNTDMCYFRGLEIDLPKLKMEHDERIELAIFAIQEYQADHDNNCKNGLDEDWIDQIYRNITAKAVESGKLAGIFDEFQANEVYRQNTISPYNQLMQ
jgi:hypothetical protein